MEFRVQSQGWGLCLFSFNVSSTVLSLYRNPKNPDENLYESLVNGIGQDYHVCEYPLFGIHDLACTFKRAEGPVDNDSPHLINDESQRHSVIESIANWSQDLVALKDKDCDVLKECLEEATEAIWTNYLPNSTGLDTNLCGDIRTIIEKELPLERRYKPPTLYNYTHDTLIPLYLSPSHFSKSGQEKKGASTKKITAFCYLRVDPRIMRLCLNTGDPSSWPAYDSVLKQLQALQNQQRKVAAIWTGLGMSQLVVMLRCNTFEDLAYVVRSLRDETHYAPPGKRNYNVVSASSTLISTSSPATTATEKVAFYILVRLRSGFHSHEVQDLLHKIAEALALPTTDYSIGRRQGMFDLIIRIVPGVPYQKTTQFIDILNCGCPFAEDVATIVSFRDEHNNGFSEELNT